MPSVEEYKTVVQDLSPAGIEIETIRHTDFLRLSYALLSIANDLKPAVVHAQGMTSVLASVPIKLFHRIPLIATLHDVAFDKLGSGMMVVFKKAAIRAALFISDKIHCVSGAAEKKLIETFPFLERRADRVVMIPNRIETAQFLDAEPRDLRQELSIDKSTRLVGFFGRFMGPKGFRVLINAVEKYMNGTYAKGKLLILAFGSGGFIREDKLYLETKGLEPVFRFFPFTPNIASTIKGLDLVVIPSLWETGPILPLEAMVCGVPIIGTDCIGLHEVLIGTPATIVKAGDASALADALGEKLSGNLGKREAENFITKAAIEFDVAQSVSAIQSLYNELIFVRGHGESRPNSTTGG